MDKIEKELTIDQLREKFYQELKNDPKALEFLEPYAPYSREHFLKHYAFRKSFLVAHSEYRMKEAEKGRRDLRYRDETENVFIAILQKKLFNVELLWRADQISLPDIRTTWDFHRWERDPRACPFIEPVTEEEIELMQQFLQTDLCDLGSWGEEMREHWFFDLFERDEEGNYTSLPEWYEYYDTYMGTGHLLLLPDTRGEKEAYYRSLCAKESKAQREAEQTANPAPPPKPVLPAIDYFSPEEHYHFSTLVDDEIFQHLFHYEWQEANDKEQAEDESGIHDIDAIIMNLENIPDPPPVRGGLSWRKALYLCWQDYLKSVVSEDLPLVWEEDKFYRETGLHVPDGKWEEADQNNADSVAEQILHGRELAGEPRDFDY